MSVLLNRQIEKIKRMILAQGALVEQAFQRAVQAVEDRDADLARQVVQQDMQIDLTEIDIEEECLATLALHQPVAHDLRFIVAVLKINNDLERIGDLASNMAEQGAALAGMPPIEMGPFGIMEMAHQAQQMVKQALDALVEVDADLAARVREMDDQIDARHRAVYDIVEQHIRANNDAIPQLIRIQITARHIERLADHAVNIAKDVIYLAKGEIVRHRRAPRQSRAKPGIGRAPPSGPTTRRLLPHPAPLDSVALPAGMLDGVMRIGCGHGLYPLATTVILIISRPRPGTFLARASTGGCLSKPAKRKLGHHVSVHGLIAS